MGENKKALKKPTGRSYRSSGLRVLLAILSTSMIGITVFYPSAFISYGKLALVFIVEHIGVMVFSIMAIVTLAIVLIYLADRFSGMFTSFEGK